MFYRFVICSFLCLVSLFSEEEIRVELTTKVQLSPTYIGNIFEENSSFKPSYLHDLKKVLSFDLAHCGYVKIAESDEGLEKILANQDHNVVFQSGRWEKGGFSYVVKGHVSPENRLDLFVFNVKTRSLKHFEKIALSGDLSLDRAKMHQLSDALVNALFGIEGVASLPILYSQQQENKDPNNTDWKAEIWQCDSDGKNARQITHEKSYSISPVLIPAHEILGKDRYLYVNYKNGQPRIYLSSLKNKTGKPIIDLRGNQILPAVSPSRDKMAFISDATGRADLFILTIGANGTIIGKPTQLYSYPRATQGSPTFSPDGSKIAFVSDKDGTPRIYLIPSHVENNKRPHAKLLTKRNRENTCPNWSPDGTKIAYSAKTSGVRQIWIYDLEAEEEQQLTMGPGNKENPCWAPNSLHLVFNSTDPDSSDLYLVNLNQPEAVKITRGSERKHYPTWGNK